MQAYKCDICMAFFTKLDYVSVRNKGSCYLVVKENGQVIDICRSCAVAIQEAINKCHEMGATHDGTKNS